MGKVRGRVSAPAYSRAYTETLLFIGTQVSSNGVFIDSSLYVSLE